MSYRILDLFAGYAGWSQAFKEAGHEVVTVDFEARFNPTIVADITRLRPDDVPGQWDIILGSPPCQKFSIATVFRNWNKPGRIYEPKSEGAAHALGLIATTLRLIEALEPRYWILENPRGLLRKLPIMVPYERRTVTFCQYGDDRMKPTDLWGIFPENLRLKPTCRNGDDCHVEAPRGSQTGTQGRKSIAQAVSTEGAEGVYAYGGFIPFELSKAVLIAIEEADQGVEPKSELQPRLI